MVNRFSIAGTVIVYFLLAAFWGSSAFAQVIDSPLKIAELVEEAVELPYQGRKLTRTIQHPGASHIKLNIETMDLVPGDTVTVTNSDGSQSYTYPGDAFTTDDNYPGFWSLTLWGDTVKVKINAQSSRAERRGHRGLLISRYWRGFSDAETAAANNPNPTDVTTASICGRDDKQDAICWANNYPTEYDKARAVARISFGGGLCTAWRIGPNDNTMVTNNHCINSQSGVNATEVWFMYENTSCNGGSTTANRVIVTGAQFLTTDRRTDLTLFTINNPAAIAQFGYLEVDVRQANNNESIYIAGHPGGRAKEMSIVDDIIGGARCRVGNNNTSGSTSFGTDMSYSCDTEGGSSGSPVLSASSQKVVALHHLGGCNTNKGARSDVFWPVISSFIDDTAPPPPPTPDIEIPSNNGRGINLFNLGFNEFSSQIGSDAEANIIESGAVMELRNNVWVDSTQTFTIEADTEITFEVSSNGTGEIFGIGFDADDTASTDRVFQLGGSQSWGIEDFVYTGNGSVQQFTIAVGQYFTGENMKLILVNDNDAGSGNLTYLGNIAISGQDSGQGLDFSTLGLSQFTNQIANDSQVNISNGGKTLELVNNVWQGSTTTFDIGPNTVLNFDFSTNGLGEILGIGFEEDNSATQERIFKLFGSQNWGINDFSYPGDGSTQSFSIPVGQYYTGSNMKLILVNDNDQGTGNVSSFSNIVITN